MQESFTRREVAVGLFLLGLLVAISLTLKVIATGEGWFQSTTKFHIKFNKGGNLRQGSPVKMLNTEIGGVTEININPNPKEDENRVEVTIWVLKKKAGLIHRDSTAEIIAPTLIGSEYIEISPGSSGYEPIPANGDISSIEHKTMSENLADLFNEETIRQARSTIANITFLTEQLKNHEKAWLATVNHVDQVIVSVIKAQGTLGELISRRDFYGRMNQSLTEIDKAILNVQKITGDLVPAAQDLQAASKTIKQELEGVRSILADIKGGTQEFPGVMETAAEATQEGKSVVEAVKANPLIRLTLPREKKSQPLYVEPRHVP